MVRFYAYILSRHLRDKRTIITRFEQSYGRVPFAGLCRSFISVYVPGAGLPGARASASPVLHELGNCQGTDGCAVGQQPHGTTAGGKLYDRDLFSTQCPKGSQSIQGLSLIAVGMAAVPRPRVGNDLLQTAAGLPAQHLSSLFVGGDQDGRITAAARLCLYYSFFNRFSSVLLSIDS